MRKIIIHILQPIQFSSLVTDVIIAIPRILGGFMLCVEFGSSKFGMPWSATEEMGLFEVASWFPQDVAKFGGLFALAPTFFAWIGAASEAIGGLFLALGLGTRVCGALLSMTMFTAIFFQKWPDAIEYGSSWPLLPAAGFLWIALYSLAFGSGKIGLDQLIIMKWKG